MPGLSHIAEQLRPLAVPVADLVPDPANARSHPEKNLAAIQNSLRAYGQRKPLVVRREGMIVEAGNGTLACAKALGWTHVAAVVVDDDALTATGFSLADNRSGELAEWDDATLARLLVDLRDEDVVLDDLGWDDAEVDALLAEVAPEEPHGEDPGAGEPPAVPVSKRGEVYALGPHRLMCGDSTSAEDVGVLMGGASADLLCSDPPYGVSYASKNEFLNNADKGNRNQTPIANDHMTETETHALWVGSMTLACDAMRPGAAYYVTGPQGGDLLLLLLALRDAGLKLKHMLIWAKNNHVLGRCDYHYKHEPIIYGWKEGAGHKFYGGHSEVSLWEINKPHKSELHPTMKPVDLAERAIKNSTIKGETVYDPFLGSGTTLIAAARQGRRCYGMEITPAYCDVVRKRWGDYARSAGIDPGPGAL